jgi:DNA invertase Pin-like site-specific DNA recombinase
MVSTPRRALILARISDARDEDTHGVEGQVNDCQRYAARLGWQCGPAGTHVIIENDTSAFKRRKVALPGGRYELRTVRPGFRRALGMLAAGDADGLVALDLDRACRDPRDLEDLIDVVESASPCIPVESVTGSLRLATDADISMARVMVAMANKSSRDTGRRVSAARRRKAFAGEFGGGVRPFGFEPDGITVRPSEATEIVKWADAILAGVSLRQILLDIRTRKVPTVTGAPWSSRTVRDILMRARNAGLAVHKGAVVGQAPWPPIMPEDTWRAVCAMLTDPARRQSPGNTPRWLGSLLYRCGICGDICRVHAVRAVGGQYRCQGSPHLARSAVRVDEFVTEVVTSRLARSDAADLLTPPASKVDNADLRREAAALRELLDEQARLHARGVIDSRQLAAGSAELRSRLARVEGQLADGAARDPLDGIAGRTDAARVWAGLDLGRRRAILASLVTVTLLSARPGRQADGGYFDSDSISFDWHR